MIVSRESMTDFPDSYLWAGGDWEKLTDNVDPFPEVTAARRIDFEFERRDGLQVHGRVSLPVGYVEGQKVGVAAANRVAWKKSKAGSQKLWKDVSP